MLYCLAYCIEITLLPLFAISEYLDFSLEDLLQHSIYPTEPEIALIVSQVRHVSSLAAYVLIQTGFGWYTVHLAY